MSDSTTVVDSTTKHTGMSATVVASEMSVTYKPGGSEGVVSVLADTVQGEYFIVHLSTVGPFSLPPRRAGGRDNPGRWFSDNRGKWFSE